MCINGMSPKEREAYERACLDTLHRLFEDRGPQEMLKAGRQIRDITLDGSYPKTKIGVRYLNARTNNEEVAVLPLWEGWASRKQGAFGDPATLALFVYARLKGKEDMSSEEHQVYERACLEAVEYQFGDTGAQAMLESGRALKDITLDGSYPDTAIKVRYANTKTGEEEDRVFHLWKGWLAEETHAFPDPERVALFVYVESTEP